MKKMSLANLVVLSAVLMSGASAFAETYQCGNRTVITSSDAGVQVDGQRLRSIGNGTYVGHGMAFSFNDSIENGQLVSNPTLRIADEVIPCSPLSVAN